MNGQWISKVNRLLINKSRSSYYAKIHLTIWVNTWPTSGDCFRENKFKGDCFREN